MPDISGKVLIIGAAGAASTLCRRALEAAGYRAVAAEDPARALDRLRRESFDAALLGLRLPGPAGLETLANLRTESPRLPVIVLAGQPSFPAAVAAIKAGAFDYLPEPLDPETVTAAVDRAVRSSRRALEDACIGRELEREPPLPALIARSPAMAPVIRLIQKAAAGDAAVLITGEPGVGKEVVARTIHRMSRRSSRRFVKVDCAAPAEGVFESGVFGAGTLSTARERGPGRVELAEGGTLFLGGITGLGLALQRNLLRFIMEGERAGAGSVGRADVRLIASARGDLQPAVRKGTFLGELHERLRGVHIAVPPLRDRPADIPALADYVLRTRSGEKGRGPRALSSAALDLLARRAWPGNVRELIRLLEHALEASPAATLQPADIPPETPEPGAPEGRLARVERGEILAALDRFGGNRTRAAGYLGIHRKTLREKMGKYRIPCPESGRRGPHGPRPPTPPDVRFRIRRFR